MITINIHIDDKTSADIYTVPALVILYPLAQYDNKVRPSRNFLARGSKKLTTKLKSARLVNQRDNSKVFDGVVSFGAGTDWKAEFDLCGDDKIESDIEYTLEIVGEDGGAPANANSNDLIFSACESGVRKRG